MDTLTYEEILQRLWVRIRNHAAFKLRDDVLAEDVAQETIMFIQQEHPALRDPIELQKLAMTVVWYKIQEAIRKRKPTVPIDERPGEDSGTIQLEGKGLSPEDLALVAELKAHIGRMGEDCRRMWEWHLRGTSYEEMQRMTGVTRNALFQRWHRCQKALRDLVNPGAKGGRR